MDKKTLLTSMIIIFLIISCSPSKEKPNTVVKIEKKEKAYNLDSVLNIINSKVKFFSSTGLNLSYSLKADTNFYTTLLNNYKFIPDSSAFEFVNNVVLQQILYETTDQCITYDLMNTAEEDEVVNWMFEITLKELNLKKEKLEWFNIYRTYSSIIENQFNYPYDSTIVDLISKQEKRCLDEE